MVNAFGIGIFLKMTARLAQSKTLGNLAHFSHFTLFLILKYFVIMFKKELRSQNIEIIYSRQFRSEILLKILLTS